jgi:hypothetical protein
MTIRIKARLALGVSAGLLALTLAPAVSAAAATAAPATTAGHGGTYVCTGGDIAAGYYRSVVVTGVCYTPAGNVFIQRDLTIAPGALLDAVTPGDPTTGTHVVPATVFVGGNVFVGKGAVLLLGCSPNISCASPPGITFDRIGGSLTSAGAQAVVVHNATIGGRVSLIGGGGGAAAQTCAAQTAGKPPIADLKPWSEDPNFDGTPVYSDFEDVSIGGGITVAGLTSCWLGSLRNLVRGNATYVGNTMGDPDALEIDNNLVGGSMTCFNNSPAVQFGDSGAAPNLVRGFAAGECGFGVVLPNPAPEADQGPGVPEHITVRTSSLGTYRGTLKSTAVTALPPVKTQAGDTIVVQLNDFILRGTGLTGSGTYDPSQPPGQSGEVVVSTIYPNGTGSFEAINNCSCSFHGKTGSVTIRSYGTLAVNGAVQGIFLVVSGGTSRGEMATLAGWGTFSSFGRPATVATLRTAEYLRIT